MTYESESHGKIMQWNGVQLPFWYSKPMASMAGVWCVDIGDGCMDSEELRELANRLDEMNRNGVEE